MKKVNYFFLDRSVTIFMLAVALVSLGSFTYRYWYYEPCSIGQIELIDNHKVVEGSPFQIQMTLSDEQHIPGYLWDFGDDTPINFTRSPFHTYKKAGEYHVTLTLDGHCKYDKTILVHEKPKTAPVNTEPVLIDLNLPDSIAVEEVFFAEDKSQNVHHWQWYFGESDSIDATTRSLYYSYSTPGTKQIIVVINGDSANYTLKHDIKVLPKQNARPRRPARSVRPSRPSRQDITDTPIEDPVEVPLPRNLTKRDLEDSIMVTFKQFSSGQITASKARSAILSMKTIDNKNICPNFRLTKTKSDLTPEWNLNGANTKKELSKVKSVKLEKGNSSCYQYILYSKKK